MSALAARLPGIRFETRTPAVPSPLPRMDIVGFVGFADAGPIHVPVPVEDAAQFHEIFGGDMVLAREVPAAASPSSPPSAAPPVRGDVVYAELPAAVRAFFRNGGIRCWVVRVASAEATANRFVVPGLLAAGSGPGGIGAAAAFARSPGSWSDGLLVNATILRSPLPVQATGTSPSFAVGGLAPGDLLQLDFSSRNIVAFQAVPDDARQRPPLVASVPQASHWFRQQRRVDLDPAPASPPDPVAWLPAPVSVRWLTGSAAPQSDPSLPIARWGVSDDRVIVELDRSELLGVQAGAWLLVELAAGPPGSTPFLLLQIDAVTAAEDDAPPSSPEPVWVAASGAWWVLDPVAAASEVQGIEPRVSRVSFELWARDPARGTIRLADLGFSAGHSRYWGDVPNDEIVFRYDPSRPTRRERVPPSLLAAVLNPRFPLSAPFPQPNAARPLFLPLGLTTLVREDFYQPALPQAASARTRDGLAALTQDLFVDSELARTRTSTFMSEAFQIQYVNEYGDPWQTLGRGLMGLHALLPVEEISMIAVPDAVQRPWFRESSTITLQEAPTLIEVSAQDCAFHLEWTPGSTSPPEEGIAYTVQASLDPRFSAVAQSWSASEPWLDDDGDRFCGCPSPVFYRVRSVSPTLGVSPWSNTLWAVLPRSVFEHCPDEQPFAPPSLTITEERGRWIVEWQTVAGNDVVYTLERASDPEFASAEVVYAGPSNRYEVLRGAEPVVFFRVAATVDGLPSPWSVTARAGAVAGEAFLAEPADVYDEGLLTAVHTAAVRMSAARGDLHAVLSLPLHFLDDHARTYAAVLAEALALDDPRVPSYAALFHPWIVVRETSGRPELSTWAMVPDGAVCGTIAARTLRNGAWYSPANQVIAGVVDLQPPLGDAVLRLLEGRVNPIWQQPEGFSAVDALTLYPGEELGELHVRRLLILLRRLATREGAAMVFRPNDDSLRRLVQREFERVLGDLFVQGAFAGTSHDEGYRVVADDSVNTPQTVDLGRFIVELRVAPSHPLVFLTVRLVQEGGTLLGVEEG
jgi:hypothetical protein